MTESVLKWVWLAWMIFALSMFLPAMRGFMMGNVRTIPGWQIAVNAHGLVYDCVLSLSLPPRRLRPFSPGMILALATVGTFVNWLVVVGGSVALLAVRKVTSETRARSYLRVVFGVGLLATILAGASVVIILNATNMSGLPGVYAWCIAPAILTLGLARRIAR